MTTPSSDQEQVLSKARVSTEAPASLLILGDLLGYILTVGPSAGALSLCIWMIHSLSFEGWLLLVALFFSPALFFFIFVSLVFLLRLLLPKMKPGTYEAGINLGFMSWVLHLGLSRSGLIFGLREFILSSHTMKYLFWNALGGKISFQTTVSLNVSLVDLPLLQISKGCTIGDNTFICAHHFVGNKLVLDPVRIDENVFIGKDCVLFPGCHLQDRSWIGLRSSLGPNVIIGVAAQVGAGNTISHKVIAANEKVANFKFS